MGKKLVLLIVGLLIVSGGFALLNLMNTKGNDINSETNKATGNYPNSSRPIYCMDDKCVPASVFSELPNFPKNFHDVWVLMNPEPYLGIFENFSVHYPDEYYWKQPEFYADSFVSQGLQYYTIKPVLFSAGTGPYPGDMFVTNITAGEAVRVSTYWHASWAIPYYQVLKLVPSFPPLTTMRLGSIVVEQEPERAKNCIEIFSIEPSNILIEPTFPRFGYEWVQKITIDILPKCSGNWSVVFSADNPDVEFEKEVVRQYGLTKVSTMRLGGQWQIALSVL